MILILASVGFPEAVHQKPSRLQVRPNSLDECHKGEFHLGASVPRFGKGLERGRVADKLKLGKLDSQSSVFLLQCSKAVRACVHARHHTTNHVERVEE